MMLVILGREEIKLPRSPEKCDPALIIKKQELVESLAARVV